MTDKKIRNDLFIIAVICLAVTLPFINKAFHIDSQQYLKGMEMYVQHPGRIYTGAMGWNGRIAPFTSASHPPLIPVLMLPFVFLTGNALEPVMHAVIIPFTFLCVLSMYFLARRFTSHPLLAGLLLLFAPGFLVISHNFMLDIPSFALWLIAINLCMGALENPARKNLAFSGILLAAACFGSYQAIFILPLILVYALSAGKDLKKTLVILAIPAAGLAIFSLYMLLQYNTLILLEALRMSGENNLLNWQVLVEKAAGNIIAAGGATLFPLALIYVFVGAGRNAARLIVSAVFSVAVLFGIAADYSFFQKLLIALFSFAGSLCFAEMLSLLTGYRVKEKQGPGAFLALWFLGYYAASACLFPFSTIRYILPCLPPLIIVFINKIEKISRDKPAVFSRNIFAAALSTTLVCGILVAYGDYVYAGIYRKFARSLVSDHGLKPEKTWFTGEWGFRYYMEKECYNYYLTEQDSLPAGSWLVRPQNIHPYGINRRLEEKLELAKTIIIKSRCPVRIVNDEAKAGFYSHAWGILPYSFSFKTPLERVHIFRYGKGNYFIRNLERAEFEGGSPEQAGPGIFTINNDSRIVLFQHPPSKLSYELEIPENSFLSFAAALDPETWGKKGGNGALFEIYLIDGHSQYLLFSRFIDPANRKEHRRWFDEKIDLREFGGRKAILKYVTDTGPRGNSSWDWAGWANPEIKAY